MRESLPLVNEASVVVVNIAAAIAMLTTLTIVTPTPPSHQY